MPSESKPVEATNANKTVVRVAVTGDCGVDTYTRYMPGCLAHNDVNSSSDDDHFYPSISYDLEVPSGAAQINAALLCLLDPLTDLKIVPALPKEKTMRKSLQFIETFPWPPKNTQQRVRRIRNAKPLKIPDQDAAKGLADQQLSFENALFNDADCLVVHDANAKWHTSQTAAVLVATYLDRFSKERESDQPFPRLLLNLGDRLPVFDVNAANDLCVNGEPSPVWATLLNPDHTGQIVVICSATSLRHAGAMISRRLSWEQTIEDFIEDINRFPTLRRLTTFGHLIIRFGFVGALHVKRVAKGFAAQFVFAPNARGGIFRDETDDGRIVGRNAVLIACLVNHIRKSLVELVSSGDTPQLNDGAFAEALETGLTVCMRLFDSGFPCTSTKVVPAAGSRSEPTSAGRQFLSRFFSGNGNARPTPALPANSTEEHAPESPTESNEPREIICTGYRQIVTKRGGYPRDRILGTVRLPKSVLKRKTRNKTSNDWQILRSQIRGRGMSRINIGIAICKFGHTHVLNRTFEDTQEEQKMCGIKGKDVVDMLNKPECRLADGDRDDQPLTGATLPDLPRDSTTPPANRLASKPIFAPILEFGKLVAIERDEIESFRSIRNLMKLYQEGKTLTDRPMSIAVFGAPGSGKSFAVKEIASDINAGNGTGVNQLEIIESNVAQFRSVEDLGHAITRIASLNNQHKIPLVFFDEFDCGFGKEPLGWLKYFLAPMQDGTFYGASQTISFGRAIFVFAGGIYKTIAEFNPFTESVPISRPGDLEIQLKKQAIFQSQKGPDFVSRLRGHINIRSINPDDTASKDETGQPIKPIIRRSLMLRGHILAAKLIANRDGCEVASVDDDVLYALLTVDTYRHGARSMEAILQMCTPIDGVIEKSSLPSRAQLNMHVNADEFFIRVQRGRHRNTLSGKPQPDGSSKSAAQHADRSRQENDASLDDRKKLVLDPKTGEGGNANANQVEAPPKKSESASTEFINRDNLSQPGAAEPPTKEEGSEDKSAQPNEGRQGDGNAPSAD
jgi:hypothetical protein